MGILCGWFRGTCLFSSETCLVIIRDQETACLSSKAGNVPFLHCLPAVFMQPGCTEKC